MCIYGSKREATAWNKAFWAGKYGWRYRFGPRHTSIEVQLSHRMAFGIWNSEQELLPEVYYRGLGCWVRHFDASLEGLNILLFIPFAFFCAWIFHVESFVASSSNCNTLQWMALPHSRLKVEVRRNSQPLS